MLAGLILSLLVAQADRTTVLVFTTTDCPISNRYAPEIQRLAAKFGERFRFVLVYPVPSDSLELIREHHKKFGYALPFQRDDTQRLVKQTGVTVSTIATSTLARIDRARRRTTSKTRWMPSSPESA